MIFCCGSNSSTSSKSMGKRLRRWLKYISKAGISIEETTSGHFICQIFPSGGTPCHLLPLSQPVRGARQDAWFYSNNVRWTEGVALKCSCCCCLGLTHYSWCWWWLSETEAKTEQWMVNGHILKTTSRSQSMVMAISTAVLLLYLSLVKSLTCVQRTYCLSSSFALDHLQKLATGGMDWLREYWKSKQDQLVLINVVNPNQSNQNNLTPQKKKAKRRNKGVLNTKRSV